MCAAHASLPLRWPTGETTWRFAQGEMDGQDSLRKQNGAARGWAVTGFSWSKADGHRHALVGGQAARVRSVRDTSVRPVVAQLTAGRGRYKYRSTARQGSPCLPGFRRHSLCCSAACIPAPQVVPDGWNDVPGNLYSLVHNEKCALADAMVALKPKEHLTRPVDQFGNGFGRPPFPELQSDISLHELVSLDLWFTPFRLELNLDFLHIRVRHFSTFFKLIPGIGKSHYFGHADFNGRNYF